MPIVPFSLAVTRTADRGAAALGVHQVVEGGGFGKMVTPGVDRLTGQQVFLKCRPTDAGGQGTVWTRPSAHPPAQSGVMVDVLILESTEIWHSASPCRIAYGRILRDAVIKLTPKCGRPPVLRAPTL